MSNITSKLYQNILAKTCIVYVNRFSHAAKAFEECDRKYRAVFAEPKNSEPLPRRGDSKEFFGSPNIQLHSGGARNSSFNNFSSTNAPSFTAGPSGTNDGYTGLTVIASPEINEDQLWKLFDIVPGKCYLFGAPSSGPKI